MTSAALVLMVAASSGAARFSEPPLQSQENVVAAPPSTDPLAATSLLRIDQRCIAGCVRYRRLDWGTDPDGRITQSVLPTSSTEWTYLSDGRSVTFHLTTDPIEQRRIVGRWSLFVNTREREASVLRGQHSPGQEGIDEMLIGCEGLAESWVSETLAEEIALARVLRTERSGDMTRLRYELPGEAEGWVHEVEWIAGTVSGTVSGTASRLVSRTLEIAQPSTDADTAHSLRVVRSEVVEWDTHEGSQFPKVVDRTVRIVQVGHADISVGRSRFEVIERRADLTASERMRVGRLAIEAGWTVSRQDRACSAVLGEQEFTFAGRRYEALNPVALADLERPELLLEGAQCLE